MWLGYDVLLMPGVKIGDGAIVAARSVVALKHREEKILAFFGAAMERYGKRNKDKLRAFSVARKEWFESPGFSRLNILLTESVMTVIRPPFTLETATAKVRAAKDAWNSRDPQRVRG